MIHFEGTMPRKLDSQNYNDFEMHMNDINDLVERDEEGNRCGNPYEYFRSILEDVLFEVVESDEDRMIRKFKNHDEPL